MVPANSDIDAIFRLRRTDGRQIVLLIISLILNISYRRQKPPIQTIEHAPHFTILYRALKLYGFFINIIKTLYSFMNTMLRYPKKDDV